MVTRSLNLESLIEGFILSCQAEGLSPKTIEWYQSFLLRFNRFLKNNNLPTDPLRIGTGHIRSFIRYLQTEARTPRGNKPLSPTSVAAYVRCCKVFFSWLAREDYVESNPMHKVPVPKVPVKVVDAFSEEQVVKFMALCLKSDRNANRDLSIILLLLDTGVRVAELADIAVEDVNLSDGYIKVMTGKGNRQRILPIGRVVQKSLWKYINNYRPKPLDNECNKGFSQRQGPATQQERHTADDPKVWQTRRYRRTPLLTTYVPSHVCQALLAQWRRPFQPAEDSGTLKPGIRPDVFEPFRR